MRLLLEGSDIEELLAQIRREHGEAARIVAADRVRSGGFAGFFARLRYEVTVEIDERASSPVQVLPADGLEEAPADAVTAPPASLLDLTEAVDAAEQHAFFTPMSPPVSSLISPSISTESNDFADVLRQLAEMAPTGDQEQAAATPDSALVATPTTGPASVGTPAGAFATTVAVAYAPHLAAGGPEAPATSSVVRDTGEDTAGLSADLTADTGIDTAVAADRWNALGLPATLHPTLAPGVSVHQALRAAMNAVPQARFTKRAGDVVAVVGEARQAYESARGLAELLRIDPATVALAAATDCVPGVPKVKRLLSPEDARRHARQLRRLPHVAIVAVESTLEAEGSEWALDVTDALEADRVWAVVDATTKTADVRRQLDRISPVDALLLTNARHTSDPAAVLSLDVPVATLDGARATPAAWARMLTTSLLEAA